MQILLKVSNSLDVERIVDMAFNINNNIGQIIIKNDDFTIAGFISETDCSAEFEKFAEDNELEIIIITEGV